jgi:hypothetical protein
MTFSYRYFCITLSICGTCFAEVPFEILRQYQTSAVSTGIFPTKLDFPTGQNPRSVHGADFDGELDIVSANANHEDRGLSVIMQGNCQGDDCNNNGIGDICELPDCNFNGIPDECDIASGTSTDCNNNGIPEDLNGDMVVDIADLLSLISYWGECSKYTLPNITGACCNSSSTCMEVYEIACEILLGTYFGDNTTGDSVECQSP